MIIDRNARVVPPRYHDREVRALMGDALGKADQADLLAAYLWVQEGVMGRRGHSDLESMRDGLLRDIETLRKFKSDPEFQGLSWECTRAELDAAFDSASVAIGEEVAHLEEALRVSAEALESLRRLPNEDLAPRYVPGSNNSPLNTIIECRNQIEPLNKRHSVLVADLIAEVDRLADLDSRRLGFSQSDKSYTPERILRFDSKNFEILVAWLANRDGMKVIRRNGGAGDLGADGIFLTPDGRRVVAQCKQTNTLPGRAIGSEPVQRFNGTARPVHEADIAVMVTNGTFSKPARDFASDHAIHLVDAEKLRKWATWGDSFYEVVGIAPPSAAVGAAA
ncbi:restriction endonuclease [Streptomyces sp. DSM 40750]|uniref:restriction endonuclease n=1 Tax=Streptomyces sp. DSM 40750 TaxID=2801030 RepID=UPI00214A9D79|nr:restriction endonuclease [Streptomyces sp. DSM 40750]UUU25523.1 restriction endonuclease [Streptomyces sp. DSM 40750]